MKRPLIVSYGGGTNSTAMLIGMYERGIRPDIILFADTGGEKPHTYAYLDAFGGWLSKHGFPAIIRVVAGRKYPTLEAESLSRKQLPSLAYGFKTCSMAWKVHPQEMHLRQWEPAKRCWASGGKVIKAIGYDLDEGYRRAKFHESKEWCQWYPLIRWRWGREECIDAIRRHGLPLPGKSACFYCPASTKSEVLALGDQYPELATRAVAMESTAAETFTVIKGLGRHWSWRELLSADRKQMRIFDEDADLPCECYDGCSSGDGG
jgi:hypothetical protein